MYHAYISIRTLPKVDLHRETLNSCQECRENVCTRCIFPLAADESTEFPGRSSRIGVIYLLYSIPLFCPRSLACAAPLLCAVSNWIIPPQPRDKKKQFFLLPKKFKNNFQYINFFIAASKILLLIIRT